MFKTTKNPALVSTVMIAVTRRTAAWETILNVLYGVSGIHSQKRIHITQPPFLQVIFGATPSHSFYCRHNFEWFLGDIGGGDGVLGDGAGVVEEARRVAARVVDPLGWRHRQRLFRRFIVR